MKKNRQKQDKNSKIKKAILDKYADSIAQHKKDLEYSILFPVTHTKSSLEQQSSLINPFLYDLMESFRDSINCSEEQIDDSNILKEN